MEGEERGSGCGDRWGETAGGSLGFVGWWRVAAAGRGELWGLSRVAVVFAEVVREIGGALGRPVVVGVFASFLGIGESLRADRDEGTRGPIYVSFCTAVESARRTTSRTRSPHRLSTCGLRCAPRNWRWGR